MGAYESHVDDPVGVVDPNDKTELVACDVENNSTVLQDARISEGLFRTHRRRFMVVPTS